MKKNKKIVEDYPYLNKLGIKIYYEPVQYIKPKDLNSKLNKKQIEVFNELFGAATCPLIGNDPCLYPWDVEDCLARLFSGKIQGTQLFWD